MTVTAELDHALALVLDPPPPYHRSIATDADGTLWAMDVGDALFLTVAERDGFVGEGLEKLRADGSKWIGNECAAWSGGRIAKRLFEMYDRGDIGVRVMCDLEAETVADRSAGEFDALLAEIAERAARAVRTEVRTFVQEAHRRGAYVHVVTGSLGSLVERSLLRAEIPADRVSGAVLAREGDRVRAVIAETSPLFEGKVDALRAGGHWPAAIGMGDGGWDHTFLKACRVAVLVHPKPALVDAMSGVEGCVRVGS
jgi:phosphoserine phosphatase